MELTNSELIKVTGGSINWTVAALIGGAITLIAGIIDGFLRPVECN